MTAIGAMHAILGAGLSIPGDFSVVGFDDIHIAQFTFPPLTTIRMSCQDLAHGAVAALCSQMGTAPVAADRHDCTIPTELIVRRTTGIPRNTMQDLSPPISASSAK
jgi:DNA-binding LacI/PurR family transcriptional regulator